MASIQVQYVPRNLRESSWDKERERLGDIVVWVLAKVCPEGTYQIPAFLLYTPRRRPGGTGILPVAGWTGFTELNGGFSCVDLSTGSDRSRPDLPGKIVHRRITTPEGLERRYRASGGHVFHGDHAPEQLFFFRPFAGYADYRPP